MGDVTVRPSLAAYEATWPQRKRQALGLGGGAVLVFLLIAVVGMVRQPSSALMILLLLGLAGLCVTGAFAIELAYLRNAAITVDSSGVRIKGVPFSRPRSSPAPAGYRRASVDFGRGVQRRVWLALDGSAKPLFWTYADVWDESCIERLAEAGQSTVSGDWDQVIGKPPAPRW